MDEFDRINLNFLMSLQTDEDWINWAKSVEWDDMVYAMELLETALAEQEVEKMELKEAIQDMDGDLDLGLARSVLAKFAL